MKKVEIKGIIVPIVTPMKADSEDVNIEELRLQVERMIAGGVHGIFAFGTNGEGYILSTKEKEEVLEAVIDQVRGRVPVYAGTGCISTRDTVYMSRRAEELGAGGIAGRANLYPKALSSIYDCFVAGDIAKAEWYQDAVATLQRVFKFGNPNTVIKKAVNLLGYPVGDCRKPFNYLCDEGIAELKAVLKENEEKGLS